MAAVEPEGTVHQRTEQDTAVEFELEGTETGTVAQNTSAHHQACAI